MYVFLELILRTVRVFGKWNQSVLTMINISLVIGTIRFKLALLDQLHMQNSLLIGGHGMGDPVNQLA